MVIRLTSSYLKGRQQRVSVNGVQSDFCTELSGIPKGSILGPLFFNCVVNSAPDCLGQGNELLQYADNFSIYCVIQSENDGACLQHDLFALLKWAGANHFLFSPTKSAHLRFSRKLQTTMDPDVHSERWKHSHRGTRYLSGFAFRSKLLWRFHHENLAVRMHERVKYLDIFFRRKDGTNLIFSGFGFSVVWFLLHFMAHRPQNTERWLWKVRRKVSKNYTASKQWLCGETEGNGLGLIGPSYS